MSGKGTYAEDVECLVAKINPLFARRRPELIGGALADLLATWLAGHVMPGDREGTEKMRERLLKVHVRAVRKLVPTNETQAAREKIDGGGMS
jgi:hypothetical protein